MIARNAALLAAVLLAAAPKGPLAAQQPRAAAAADSFPHTRHGRLFTTCSSCHEGITTGDTATARPTTEFCAQCHDGTTARQVTWSPRPPRPTNLRFDHRRHYTGLPDVECGTCHAISDSTVMDVGRAQPDKCMMCHAEGDAPHLAQPSCSRCHRPLAETTRLAAADIARLPKPPSHDSGWVWNHQRSADSPVCATCHTRDWCASCHVNARTVAPIQALALDARLASLLRGRRQTYRAPASHATEGFFRTHGPMARSTGVTECANCHARESCLGCHRAEERVAPVAALPSRRGNTYGVDLAGIRPPDHLPNHQLHHRVPAAGGDATCNRCHAPTFCASCHDASRTPGFHGANFVQRHSQDAYTRDRDCAACHQVQAFCVSCHRATGQSTTGVPIGKFHDNQPNWQFGHGAVARRSIESCQTCHVQSFCMQCHSAATGQKIDPHGPGFNPAMGNKNPAMCRMCHLNGPPTP
jgi:hypothetical protein